MRRPRGACSLVTWLLIAGSPGSGVIAAPGGGLQILIDDASDGDTILVPAGNYAEAIDFDGKRITLRAEEGPFLTTIDATGLGVSAVIMATPPGPADGEFEQRLEGFRITGGDASFGGGVFVAGPGAQTIANCIIEANTANFGAGLFIDDGSTVDVYNTIIVENTATGFGAAIFSNVSRPFLTGCTITRNTGGITSGVVFSVASAIQMSNSIIYANTPPSILGVNPQIRFSDIEGGWPGGNINADPLFTDPIGGDFRPSVASPCLDAGSNADVPAGVVLDVRGNERVVASDGEMLAVDMGAVEYQGVEDGDPLPPIILEAPNGSTVLVRPGNYEGPIDFGGKSITLKSTGGPGGTTIVPPKGGGGPLVLFTSGEGVNSILDGFSVEGGSASSGGAMVITDSQPTILNCIFRNNNAFETGGALAITNGSPDLVNCVFIDNSIVASLTGGSFGGGAIFNQNSSPRITNCTFLRNDGVEQGGAILSDVDSDPVIVNSVFWSNMPDQIAGPAAVSYSDVEGGYAGSGNIDQDPLAVDEVGRLGAASPCIDAGDTTAFPSNLDLDLDAFPRFFDDPDTKDSGKGAPPIDMGAFEFQGALATCPEDFNDDQIVGFAEILAVLGAWGPCEVCIEDIDQDGDVGFGDILRILGAWGPCP